MAKEILDQTQKKFLDLFKSQKDLVNVFYLTGGTALANYYLSHRYSDDLDFFTTKENFDWNLVFEFMAKAKKDLLAKDLIHNKLFDRRIFYLKFKNDYELKVEFTLYPFQQIEKPKKINGILVDSFIDLAANKLFCIVERNEIKDYADLYFILKKLSIDKIRKGVLKKFELEIENISLGSRIINVEDFKTMPRMIKKLTLRQLKNFFLEEGTKFRTQILK